MVPTAGLNPERDFVDVDLRVYDARNEVVVETRGRDLLADLAKGGVLRNGRRYRLEVAASTREGVCALRRRAVGRANFEHGGPPYTIPVQVGCADEIAPTRGQPVHARLLQSISATVDGAIIAGGAAMLDASFVPTNPVRVVERYDITSGRFVEIGELSTQRLFAPTLTLRDGRVLIAGGQNPFLGCDETIEVLWPPEAAPITRPLAAPRCSSAAVLLADGLAFFGGMPAAPPLMPAFSRMEVHDDTFSFEPREATGGVARSLPAVAPLTLGRGAFLAGGLFEEPGPLFELALTDCEGSPCLVDVDTDPEPPLGWAEMSATYVPCEQGGGAVYVVGGVIREEGVEDEVELDDVWCWLDRPEGGVLRRTASLPETRTYHRSFALPNELLVIGEGSGLRIPVDPCACTAQAATIEANSVNYPAGPLMLLHDAVQLDDESILIHGGVSTFDAAVIAAERSAWLFVRDVDWR